MNNSTKDNKGSAKKTATSSASASGQSKSMSSQNKNLRKDSANQINLETGDVLKILKEITDASIEEKIEIARLLLEKEQLDVDKAKAEKEQRFLNKHFAATLTAIISLGAVIVSFAQIWLATIQSDKELNLSRIQKDKELETVSNQQAHQRKLDLAKFILEHGKDLLGKDSPQRKLTYKVMIVSFPEFSGDLVDNLEAVADTSEIQADLKELRKNVLPKIQEKVNKPTSRLKFERPDDGYIVSPRKK